MSSCTGQGFNVAGVVLFLGSLIFTVIFPGVCADLLFGKFGLAESRSTHGLNVGSCCRRSCCSVRTPLAGCGARAGSLQMALSSAS